MEGDLSLSFQKSNQCGQEQVRKGVLKKKKKGKGKKKAAFLSSVKSRKSTSMLSLTLLFSNRHPEEQHTQKEPAPLPLRKNTHRNSPQTFCGNLSPRDRYWRLQNQQQQEEKCRENCRERHGDATLNLAFAVR